MATRSPKHGLTLDSKGWTKSVNGKTRRICGKVDAAAADRIYEERMTELWSAATPGPGRLREDAAPLDRLFSAWIHIRRTGGGIKPATIRAYEDCLNSFIDALPDGVRFADI